jgi:excisionase family DNA binding protein
VDNSTVSRFDRLDERLDKIETLLRQRIAKDDGSGDAEFLSIKQAATLASLSSTKIRREIKAGRLPASDVGTPAHPHYRIARLDLQAWMEMNRGGNVPPSVPIFMPTANNRHFPELRG